LTAVLALLGLPPSAAAVDRFVDDTGANAAGCTNFEAPCATINYAVEQAADGDTIFIDEGTYVETVSTTKVLTFDGDGTGNPGETEGATIVRGPNGVAGPGAPAFSLPNGGTVRVLRAEGGDGAGGLPGFAGGPGVAFASAGPSLMRLEGALLIGGDAGGLTVGGAGLRMEGNLGGIELVSEDTAFMSGAGAFVSEAGAVVSGSAAVAEFIDPQLGAFGEPLNYVGLAVMDGASAAVEEGFAIARFGAAVEEGVLTLNGTVLLTEIEGVGAVSSAAGTTAEAEIRNSLVFTVDEVGGVARTLNGGGSATLTAVGSTFLTINGPAVAAQGAPTGGPAKVILRNAIARNDEEEEPPVDLLADRGTIDADYSSFTTVLEENGGSSSAPGSGNNIAGDPGFAEGTGLFGELAENSPLIDMGDQAVVREDERDYVGEPRSLDGDGDCVAMPDIGAFELTGKSAPCPPSVAPPILDPPPVVSGFGIASRVFAPKGGPKRSAAKRGTRFTYTLSEPAKVAITIERRTLVRRNGKVRFVKITTLASQEGAGKQSTAFSGRVRGKALKPGRYRARLEAVDSAGQRSQPRQLGFRIVR
jgi:hypothetical protein